MRPFGKDLQKINFEVKHFIKIGPKKAKAAEELIRYKLPDQRTTSYKCSTENILIRQSGDSKANDCSWKQDRLDNIARVQTVQNVICLLMLLSSK